MDPESVAVTAGLGGFLSFFLLAVALYFLMRNMTARMRRMAYREEQGETAVKGEQGSARSDSTDLEDGPADGSDVG